jgi:fructokinase
MAQVLLFPLVRKQVAEILHGYVQAKVITRDIESYIVPPGLGKQSGICGALALAIEARKSPSPLQQV